MTDYPKTCSECGTRRDGPFAAMEDWEYAREKLEAELAVAQKMHRVAVAQRDAAWAENERLRAKLLSIHPSYQRWIDDIALEETDD